MRLAVVMIAAFLVADQSPAGTQGPDETASTVAGQYTENATFLGHGYVKLQSSVDRVPDLASRMQTTYLVNYWFTNVGRIDGSGAIVQPETELASVVPYLNAVNDYETASGASFRCSPG